MYTMMTPNDHTYRYAWLAPMHNYLEFDVMACNDAHLALSKRPPMIDADNAYEVFIGGYSNQK